MKWWKSYSPKPLSYVMKVGWMTGMKANWCGVSIETRGGHSSKNVDVQRLMDCRLRSLFFFAWIIMKEVSHHEVNFGDFCLENPLKSTGWRSWDVLLHHDDLITKLTHGWSVEWGVVAIWNFIDRFFQRYCNCKDYSPLCFSPIASFPKSKFFSPESFLTSIPKFIWKVVVIFLWFHHLHPVWSGIEFFIEDCQGKRFKGTSRHCQVGVAVGRAVSGNIRMLGELSWFKWDWNDGFK